MRRRGSAIWRVGLVCAVAVIVGGLTWAQTPVQVLRNGNFEADGNWKWDQNGGTNGSLLQSIGADSAHSGARVAVLRAHEQGNDTLDQVVTFPESALDSMELSFHYQTLPSKARGLDMPLTVRFVDLETGQDTLATTVYPSDDGWKQAQVPLSMGQLGLVPGKQYVIRFQAGDGQASRGLQMAAAAPTYLIDDASLMLLPIDPGGGGTPDDEVPDPDEGTPAPSALNPLPTSVLPHYGQKEGGDKVTISGSGFDPAKIKVKFRVGTTGGNWGAGINCGPTGCASTSNNDNVANIGAMQMDGTQITMGPSSNCLNCGTPKSNLGYGNTRVNVKNLNTGNSHGLPFKNSSQQVVGFSYGWPAPTITSIDPISASIKGGATVTIQGSGFAYNEKKPTTVTIGQLSVVLTRDSFQNQQPDGTYSTLVGTTSQDGWWVKNCDGTKLGVTGTPVNVKVTNPDGRYAQLAGGFTFTGNTPTITSASPASGPSSSSLPDGSKVNVTISGTDLRRIRNIFFGGTEVACNDITGVPDGTGITVVPPQGCGTVDVFMKSWDAFGQSLLTNAYTYQHVAPVSTGHSGQALVDPCVVSAANSYPFTATFTFNTGAHPCDDIAFTSVAVTTRPGGAQSDISTGMVTVQNNSTTPPTAVVTVPWRINTCDCSAIQKYYTMRLTVNNTYFGQITATADLTVNKPSSCSGNLSVSAAASTPLNKSVNFTATASGGTGAYVAYSWVFGDGGSSFMQNPTHQYATSGTRTATVTVTDSSGATASGSVQVAIP